MAVLDGRSDVSRLWPVVLAVSAERAGRVASGCSSGAGGVGRAFGAESVADRDELRPLPSGGGSGDVTADYLNS
jgi:hypothetical protein